MRVNELAGEEVDLNSNRQIGETLFDKLKLDPRARRTAKTKQYSTREEILRRLEGRHEIVGQILHYRTCAKLLSNYVSQLPGAIHEPTGRVHKQYNQASIVTGRIQSDHPNLQVIPVRTELGRRIRGAFTARDEDHLLLAALFSCTNPSACRSSRKTVGQSWQMPRPIHMYMGDVAPCLRPPLCDPRHKDAARVTRRPFTPM